MTIDKIEVPIRDIVDGYEDRNENGVVCYGGKLDLRPPFQREFIYNEKDQKAVVNTVLHGFPLNVMYWIINKQDTYEILDGQQRTISICKYVRNEFSMELDGYSKIFGNLTDTEKEKILNYKLDIYICEGDDKEKLDWFDVINTVGKQLTKQERRNAIFTGPWLTEVKKHFSKTNCAASVIGGKYVSKSVIRQEFLEEVLKWIADRDGIGIDDYMGRHQADTNCNDLWLYFQSVINWVEALFGKYYRDTMKNVEWGLLYNKYKDNTYDPYKLEDEIRTLMLDDDVSNQVGIYSYIFDHDERHLNIRAFSKSMAKTAYERQKGICPMCGKHFKLNEMEADHITPWSKGGKTIAENCQMLCADCNRRKSNI